MTVANQTPDECRETASVIAFAPYLARRRPARRAVARLEPQTPSLVDLVKEPEFLDRLGRLLCA